MKNQNEETMEQIQARQQAAIRTWHVVQNGKQIDIHELVPLERREITVAADVREIHAHIMAKAPEALRLLRQGKNLFDPESETEISREAWLEKVAFLLGDNVQSAQ